MRLIDADALLENLPVVEKDEQISLIGAVADMVVLISNAPTIDAVPVVRCKDCIHAVDITNYRMAKRFGDCAKQCMRCRGDSGFGYLDLSVVYPDGFCDEGEKRND